MSPTQILVTIVTSGPLQKITRKGRQGQFGAHRRLVEAESGGLKPLLEETPWLQLCPPNQRLPGSLLKFRLPS